jgi:hypothetical protein
VFTNTVGLRKQVSGKGVATRNKNLLTPILSFSLSSFLPVPHPLLHHPFSSTLLLNPRLPTRYRINFPLSPIVVHHKFLRHTTSNDRTLSLPELQLVLGLCGELVDGEEEREGTYIKDEEGVFGGQ